MPRILIHDLDTTEKGIGSDMALYFKHTFVRLSKDGVQKPIWVKYNGLDTHMGTSHSFSVPYTKEEILVPYDPKSKAYLEWDYPVGWFNTKKSAVYCERVPKRQYYKGISPNGNFKATTAEAIANECGLLNGAEDKVKEVMEAIKQDSKAPSIGVEFLDGLSTNQYPSFEDAYLLLRAKKVFCRALSRDFSMIPHPKTKDFIVLCHDVPVAELLTKNKLKMIVPEFKPECISYFQEKGVSVVS